MTRYTPAPRGATNAMIGSWQRALRDGFTLPWHDVLRSQSSLSVPIVGSAWFPYALAALLAVGIGLLWRGVRFESRNETAGESSGESASEPPTASDGG
jgi:hypothetical protein